MATSPPAGALLQREQPEQVRRAADPGLLVAHPQASAATTQAAPATTQAAPALAPPASARQLSFASPHPPASPRGHSALPIAQPLPLPLS